MMRNRQCLLLLFAATIVLSGVSVGAEEPADGPALFARENLVAWCIVPFDAKRRGPQQRAEMLQRLGLTKLAYDWRAEHVPTFEQEILALKQHGIEMFSFWGTHEEAFRLFEKHDIRPQVWVMMPNPAADTQEQKVEAAARQLMPLAARTARMGCKLGLYNHGGWAGEPENMTAVCRWLREHAEADHVGIIYNFHHGHEHLDRFPGAFNAMTPYLLFVDLNGMNRAGPKILPLGQGEEDLNILRMVRDSGYRGPIGILDHRGDTDAEQSLRENIEGLKKLLGELGDDEALKSYAR